MSPSAGWVSASPERWGKEARGVAKQLFAIPPELTAGEPPEARGVPRDEVRMMVSDSGSGAATHTNFRDLPKHLAPGDLLVVNQSGTINAALSAWWKDGPRVGERVELHLSTPLPRGFPDQWVVELREPREPGSVPLLDAVPGEALRLMTGASVTLLDAYRPDTTGAASRRGVRLWVAHLDLPTGVLEFADRHGWPIRYRYVRDRWPLSDYQTVFATEAGSAEMPSAGRPFTQATLSDLRGTGVSVAPVLLHTGVASLEADEPPYPERFRVPLRTAERVNATRRSGGRVIAVGTTVVRALETVASKSGEVSVGSGWTDLIITPERGIHAVDGILTGFHEPSSSHLSMLEALAGREHVEEAYRAALEERYLWHEFGDVHLLLRGG